MDLKGRIQERAEELVMGCDGKDWEELNDERQQELYVRATEYVWEALFLEAEC